ncbi:cyanidin-3-O-glucoside 2-O-glucuronosyltransferase-like [Momordica charantia]|uniref:Cyanidin-3-O-glucoside 2-O-glucuronosyltransferase-like n=1 Tax=Momordica charantia TaxID=3673 RepID=A0A6J1DAV3_MOMCH|nr:cyanidin-3-O-glucoside 2-O-glucuronosyltransferase-like [Momordica charantia]
MEESKNTSKKVVMFPWLAHGHISPFLELAKKLADNNFTIFLCSSPVILQNVKPELPDHYSASIELVELNIPSSPELPPQMHTTNGLPLRLIPTLANALNMAAPDFSAILQKLNPDLLIFDIFQPWAAEIASSFHIPAILLFTFGYCTTALALHSVQSSDTKFPFPELTKPFNLKKRVNIPRKGGRILKCLLDLEHSSETILVNSFTEIEGDYMEYVSVLSKKKVLPIGPLVQKSCSKEDDESEILRWLDRKNPKSTVYVAFGSEYYLEKEDIVEIAHGLELSGVNYIWIVRFPKGERIAIEEALPDGFLERIGDRGIVIDEWAPQMKILGHSSVGAFLSHCG